MALVVVELLNGDDLVSSRLGANANNSYANEERNESKRDDEEREGGGDHGTSRIREISGASRAKFRSLCGDVIMMTSLQSRRALDDFAIRDIMTLMLRARHLLLTSALGLLPGRGLSCMGDRSE